MFTFQYFEVMLVWTEIFSIKNRKKKNNNKHLASKIDDLALSGRDRLDFIEEIDINRNVLYLSFPWGNEDKVSNEGENDTGEDKKWESRNISWTKFISRT